MVLYFFQTIKLLIVISDISKTKKHINPKMKYVISKICTLPTFEILASISTERSFHFNFSFFHFIPFFIHAVNYRYTRTTILVRCFIFQMHFV